jgi:DNA-binding beta-propeller fold protein YncE
MPGIKKYAALALAALAVPCPPPVLAKSSVNDVPNYRVDTSWPKQLPGNWIMGQVGGMSIDDQDHIWILQRPRALTADVLGAAQTPPRSLCCNSAPPVLEFDVSGNLIRSWGGPGVAPDWPKIEHAIRVDRSGNVWISGNGATDRQVIKFSPDGKQLLEIGHPSDAPVNNQDISILGKPAGIDIDEAAHEVYIADGYLNSRVVVYDSNTGVFKRGWGAYGISLDQISNEKTPYVPGAPPAKEFSTVHCAKLSIDGLVYVCDRVNDRIQVFTTAGKFLKEFFLRPATIGGSVFTIAFSHDKAQKYLLLTDGTNELVSILRRSDGAEVAQIGHGGRNAGQFLGPHQLVMDSKGNLYVGEGLGQRIQKFILRHPNSLPRRQRFE